MDITEYPFSKKIGLLHSNRTRALLSLPDDKTYHNHIGTIHAGALITLAESSTGEYLLRAFDYQLQDYYPVIRRLNSKFRKPALGEVFSRVEVSDETMDVFKETLKRRKRAAITLVVDIFDAQEVNVMTAEVEWFVVKVEQ